MKDLLSKLITLNPLEYEMIKEAGRQHVGLPPSSPFNKFVLEKSDIPHTAFHDFIYDRNVSDTVHKVRSDKGGSLHDAIKFAYKMTKHNWPMIQEMLGQNGHTYAPQHTAPNFHGEDGEWDGVDSIMGNVVLPFAKGIDTVLAPFS